MEGILPHLVSKVPTAVGGNGDRGERHVGAHYSRLITKPCPAAAASANRSLISL